MDPTKAPKALRLAHKNLRAYAEGGHKLELLAEAKDAVFALGEAAWGLATAVEKPTPVLESK